MERALQIVLVAAIVLILSLYVPRTGHQQSNDSAAVANLRTINTAEITFRSFSGGSYGTIADLIAAGILDETFTGTKAGYNYSIRLGATGSVYTAEATPASAKTGRFEYYSHPDRVVRYSTNASLAPAGQSGRSAQ